MAKQTWFMVDVEADGPIPGDYSMFQFGIVAITPGFDKTFLGRICPISDKYQDIGYNLSKVTREEVLKYPNPVEELSRCRDWIYFVAKDSSPRMISDNNGFDFMFMAWYFHHFLGENPFGHSSMNLGSFYKGIMLDSFANFKHLRDTRHTHNPVDDSKGNAEALIKMIHQNRVKWTFK